VPPGHTGHGWRLPRPPAHPTSRIADVTGFLDPDVHRSFDLPAEPEGLAGNVPAGPR